MCDRKRPRSTYVNKRFLSRTVASVAHSRLSHGRARLPAVGSTSRDEVDESRCPYSEHTSTMQQHRTAVSHHPQRGTSALKTADKRKRSADSSQSNSDSSGDQEQSNVYDVHDYMRLNKQYKLQEKSETVAGSSSHGSMHCSSTCSSTRRTK